MVAEIFTITEAKPIFIIPTLCLILIVAILRKTGKFIIKLIVAVVFVAAVAMILTQTGMI